jgi:dephospho-CoA kinase
MNRDSSSREDALGRLGSQLPISEKVIYADIVIDNSGSKSELENHVKGLIKRLETEAGWTWWLSWLLPPLGLLAAAFTLWRQRQGKRKLKARQQ